MQMDQDDQQPASGNSTTSRNVIYISLGVLVAAAVIAYVFALMSKSDQYYGVGYGMIMIFVGGVEAFLLLLFGIAKFFSRPPDDEGYGDYFIAVGLVLIVGASLCFGGLYSFDLLR